LTLSILFLVGASLIICLPMILSSSWINEIATQKASQALGQPIKIESINFTWGRGLEIRGLQIKTDQDLKKKNILTLTQLSIQPQWSNLLSKKLSVVIDLSGLDMRYLKGPTGRTNWDLLRPKPKEEKTASKTSRPLISEPIEMNLPIDLGCRIHMEDLSFQIIDLRKDYRLTLYNTSMSLDLPSIHQKPISTQIRSSGSLNGKPLPPLKLALTVHNLLDQHSNLDPRRIGLKLLANIPGSRINISGGLNHEGITSQIDIKLKQLLSTIGPLIPAPLPEINGSVHIKTQADYDSNQEIQTDLLLKASNLLISGADISDLSGDINLSFKASGNPRKKVNFNMNCHGKNLKTSFLSNQLGPLSFELSQQGVYQLNRQSLDLYSGNLTIQEQNSLHWTARITSVQSQNPDIDFRINKGQFKLQEILTLTQPLLTKKISFNFLKGYPGLVQINDLHFRGQPPPHEQDITLDQIKIALPPLDFHSEENRIKTGPLALSLYNSTIKMQSAFPSEVRTIADLQVNDLVLHGIEDISIGQLDIFKLQLVAEQLKPNNKSLLGLIGQFHIHEQAKIERLALPNQAFFPRVTQELNLDLKFKNPFSCLIDLQELKVTSPEMTFFTSPKKPLKTGFNFRSTGKFCLNPFEPMMTDIEDMAVDIDLGRSLNLKTNLQAMSLGKKELKSQGKIKLDLAKLKPLLIKSLPFKSDFSGQTEINWSLTGRVPNNNEIKLLKSPDALSDQSLNKMYFLHNLKLTSSMKQINLKWPLPDLGWIQIVDMKTKRPLTIDLSKGLSRIALLADIDIKEIQNVPGLEKLDYKPGLSLLLEASISDLNQIRLTERLKLKPLSITQTAKVVMDNLGSLLNKSTEQLLPVALSKLQAQISGGFQADFGSSGQILAPGIALGNRIKADFRADLAGEDRLDLDLKLISPGFEAKFKDMALIKGLQSQLELSKTFYIHQAQNKPMNSKQESNLSKQVLEPVDEIREKSFDSRRQDKPYWLKEFGQQPDLALAQANLQALPFPINISDLSLNISQTKGIPGIESFQLDLFSGTLVGKARIVPRESGFGLDLACSFSGLDANQVLPKRLRSKTGSAASQISGRLSLDLPFEEQIAKMIQKLDLKLDLTHIGSQTLQKFLYAMDPSGSNEAIVRQRKLLDLGRPKRIKLSLNQGSLSLSGQVVVKGIEINLPSINRLLVSELPLEEQLSDLGLPFNSVNKILKTIAGQEIILGKDKSLYFNRTNP